MPEEEGLSKKEMMMVRAIAEALTIAMREGNKDPIKEHRARQAKIRGEEGTRLQREQRQKIEDDCTHMFPFPYANITRVAWAQQSDGVWRGFCPSCQGVFAPGHPKYNELVRLPRHPLEAQSQLSAARTY